MKQLLIILTLLLYINTNAQSIYDKIQDVKIAKTLSSDSMLLSKLAIQTIRGNAIVIKQIVDSLVTANLIIRSNNSGKRLIALEADSLSQGKKITVLQAQVKQLQTDRTLLAARVAALEAKIIATDTKATTAYARATTSETNVTAINLTATTNTKAITALQSKVKVLEKLDTVKGLGSLKIVKVGINQYQFYNDTATATKQGNLTPYIMKMIKDLRLEVTALKKVNTGISLSAKVQSDTLQFVLPKKKKNVVILIKQ